MGHPAAEPGVALGVTQEIDDLGQLGLGLVDPGDVVERHPDLLGIDPPGLGAAEAAQRTHPATRRGAPRQQDEQPDQQQRRPEPEQDLGQQRGAGDWDSGR